MRTEATRHFHTLADTLSKWFEPIIRMWRFSKNNGITEGFHRKIKGIQRRGYGYRNFQNYKLRVLVALRYKVWACPIPGVEKDVDIGIRESKRYSIAR